MPSTCVWTDPENPTVQTSLLIVVTLGEIAEGGGELTVVSDLLVESVTMGCAIACWAVKPKQITIRVAHTYRMSFIALELSSIELQ
jgi:hypothetical protein